MLNKHRLNEFINEYIRNNNINVAEELKIIENKWLRVSKSFWPRAEKIFKTKLPNKQITIYLTISDVCAYNIKDGYFFVTNSPHQKIREKVKKLWIKHKNIKEVVAELLEY